MKATIADLRYHMNEVLKALDRNENVEILYRGKTRCVLIAKVEKSFTRVSVSILKKQGVTMSFIDWLKIGLPYTLLTTATTALFILAVWR